MGNHHDNGVKAIKLRLTLHEGLLVLQAMETADIGRRNMNGSKVRKSDIKYLLTASKQSRPSSFPFRWRSPIHVAVHIRLLA